MDPTIQAAIIAAVAALVGVVIGALPTYLIARSQHKMELARFYSQRWWEKKEEAYTAVIGTLVALTYSLDEWTRE